MEKPEPWLIPYHSTLNGDSPLYSLNLDVVYEIMRHLDFEYQMSILACRLFADADRSHRSLMRSYGKYMLTSTQSYTFDWVYGVWETDHVAVLKAPPSWGKTVLMLSIAIEEAKSGKRVLIQTTAAMIDPFLAHLKDLSSDMIAFDKEYLEKRDDGKLRLLVTRASYSRHHMTAYNAGLDFDIALTTSYYTSPSWYQRSIEINIKDNGWGALPHKFRIKKFDVLIMDEAHKSNGPRPLLSHTFRHNKKARALIVSASDIPMHFLNNPLVHYNTALGNMIGREEQIPSSVLLHQELRFSRALVTPYIPDYNVKVHTIITDPDTPQYVLDNLYVNLRQGGGWMKGRTDHGISLLHTFYVHLVLEILDGLHGRTLIFCNSHLLPWRSPEVFRNRKSDFRKEKRYGWMWHEKQAQIDQFEAEAAENNPVLITNYKRGAEGLNFNNVDNIVLVHPEKISHEKYYQCISRGLRIRNRNESIQVICAITDTRDARIRLSVKMVDEDFFDAYWDNLGRRIENHKLITRKNRLVPILGENLDEYNDELSNEDIFILLGPAPLKADREKFLKWVEDEGYLQNVDGFPELLFKRAGVECIL